MSTGFRLVISAGRKGWRHRVAELWRYRELLLVLTSRDIRVRYKQTLMGAAWAVLQPVAAMRISSELQSSRTAGMRSSSTNFS